MTKLWCMMHHCHSLEQKNGLLHLTSSVLIERQKPAANRLHGGSSSDNKSNSTHDNTEKPISHRF